ncbi:MAG: hypothetical protein DRP66_03470 [Planctomycetota bacterium]|nr:MAG: hypothetical protein DRP66_03470 [Planctomycetota bacterium]
MDKLNVMSEKWDYLIILDACRYDYFEQVYKDYIQGDLSRVVSAGSCTNEWRDKSFSDYYEDIVYISANPQICADQPVYDYCAGEHFSEVHEIWKDGWDREKGTVLPQTLTEAALEIISRSPNSGKRYIIHYLQPHAPYLGLSHETGGYLNADINKVRSLVGAGGNAPVSGFKVKLFRLLMRLFERNRLLTNKPQWFLRKFLAIPPKAPLEAAWRSAGRCGLRKAYKANLTAVLQQVAVLIRNLSGGIIVTSDHGELLGEGGCYGHPPGSTNPLLLTVPWLVVDRENKDIKSVTDTARTAPKDAATRQKVDQSADEDIVDKLRALGYYD